LNELDFNSSRPAQKVVSPERAFGHQEEHMNYKKRFEGDWVELECEALKALAF
jgi:hypothetical protein